MRAPLYLLSLLVFTTFTWIFFSSTNKGVLGVYYSGGAAASGMDRTGGPVSSGATCANCHSGGGFNPSLTVTVKNLSGTAVTSYVPGNNYTVEYLISNTAGSPTGYGMQSVALRSGNVNAGNFTTPVSSSSQVITLSGRKYAEHQGMNSSNLFIFNWTAPAQGSGNVTFYSIGNAVNGNGGSNGDTPTSPVNITIVEASPTFISYGSINFCSNSNDPTPIVTGNQGGTFSASPAGLVINSSTGTVDISASNLGNYTITYTHSQGVATRPFRIYATYQINNSATICSDDSLFLAGAWQNTPGSYVSDLNSINGCDSVVTTQLTVNPVHVALYDLDICPGDSTLIEGVYYEVDTTLSFTSQSALGCDSTRIYQVNILPIDTGVVQNGSSLSVSGGNDSYQWIDCSTMNPIFGENTSIFVATQSGSYAILVTNGNCTLQSDCYLIDFAGVQELAQTKFEVFPNPTNGIIRLIRSQKSNDLEVKILDLQGRQFASYSFRQGQEQLEINIPETSGLYLMQISDNKGETIYSQRISRF